MFGLVWALVYIVDFLRLSRGYRKSEYWWLLLLFPGSLASLFAFIVVSRLLGDSLIRRIVGVVLYSGLVMILPWLHRLMRLSMRRAKKSAAEMEKR
jgi:uncharacterized membrane protein YfcA